MLASWEKSNDKPRQHTKKQTLLCLQRSILVKAMVFPVVMYGCEWKWSHSVVSNSLDYSLAGSSVHGIFQAIVLECIAISFSRGSSQPRAWTRVSCIVDRRFTVWATREVLDNKKGWAPKNWCFWTVVLEKTLESPLDSKEIKPVNPKGNQPEFHWKDWCWCWSSNILATWCKKLTHWKRFWCWERLRAGGEGDNRRQGCWMASPTQWTWVWTNSSRWLRTGKPGMLQSMGSQRVRHNWGAEQQQWNICYIHWINIDILLLTKI